VIRTRSQELTEQVKAEIQSMLDGDKEA